MIARNFKIRNFFVLVLSVLLLTNQSCFAKKLSAMQKAEFACALLRCPANLSTKYQVLSKNSQKAFLSKTMLTLTRIANEALTLYNHPSACEFYTPLWLCNDAFELFKHTILYFSDPENYSTQLQNEHDVSTSLNLLNNLILPISESIAYAYLATEQNSSKSSNKTAGIGSLLRLTSLALQNHQSHLKSNIIFGLIVANIVMILTENTKHDDSNHNLLKKKSAPKKDLFYEDKDVSGHDESEDFSSPEEDSSSEGKDNSDSNEEDEDDLDSNESENCSSSEENSDPEEKNPHRYPLRRSVRRKKVPGYYKKLNEGKLEK